MVSAFIATAFAQDDAEVARQQHAVMTPDDLRQFVADRLQEIHVGREDPTLIVEFDDRPSAGDCVDLARILG